MNQEFQKKMQAQPPPYTADAQPQMATVQPHVITSPGTTVIHSNMGIATMVPVVVGQQMGPNPSAVTCKSCNYEIITRVERKATMRTHLFALLLCLFGCWPCVCIPYCTESCNNANHYCPNCQAYIGTYMN